MLCLLDMDGVIVDFVKGACDVFGLAMAKKYPLGVRAPYSMEDHLGIPASIFWARFDREFWANLEPTTEAHLIVETLERKFGQDNICILSSPISTNTGACVDGKLDWIGKHLPAYKRRFMFGPQKKFCVAPDRWLVDDHDDNINAFVSHGGRTILVGRPWNSSYAVSTAESFIEQCDRLGGGCYS